MSNEPTFLKLQHGGAPNPDRHSNTRKRQERITKLASCSEEQKWWLDEERGFLRKETLQALNDWQKEKTT